MSDHRLLQSTFAIDLVAMIFGMPAALFPVLAVTQFDRGPEVVGLLFAAPAVGALARCLLSGWVARIRRQGEAVIWAVAGWGAAIAAFGLVGSNLPLGAGLPRARRRRRRGRARSSARRSCRSTVPDRLRGRLSGIFSWW